MCSNVAPSTATKSVVHNAQFAAAYGGMHHFAPMEIMYQETSLEVMGLLLVHDVRNTDAPANPASAAAKKFRTPLQLFTHGSFHGGVWRCAYKIGNIGIPSVLAFYAQTHTLAIALAGAGSALAGNWLLTGSFVPAVVGGLLL